MMGFDLGCMTRCKLNIIQCHEHDCTKVYDLLAWLFFQFRIFSCQKGYELGGCLLTVLGLLKIYLNFCNVEFMHNQASDLQENNLKLIYHKVVQKGGCLSQTPYFDGNFFNLLGFFEKKSQLFPPRKISDYATVLMCPLIFQ